MNSIACRTVIVVGALAASLSAQTVLSNFSGPSADGWTGSINGTTVFSNGFTAPSGVTFSGNDVLNLSDGGFGGGAVRTYSGLPTGGFVTFSVLGRIDTDPGTLSPDPNSNPGQFGASFGIAAGNTGLADQAFGYSRSLATTANNSGQSFALYAATVRADGTGDFTAFFTPDQHDNAVGGGTWVAQFDDVVHEDCFAPPSVLSDFASGTDGWASITPTTAPFGSGFTGVTQAAGELVLNDAGFTGGAFKTYPGAAATAGIHNVLVDVRIVTDSGSVDRARIAATAGGVTTTFSDLSFSQSFATTGDDSGQAYQTVAVPVITTGPSDITVYLLADYDAGIGSGAWEIRLDTISVSSQELATTWMSSACAAGYHSLGGPVLAFPAAPTLGSTFVVNGSNLAGTTLCGLLVGPEIAPVDLQSFGSFPGSQSCVQATATFLCAGGSPTTSVSFNIPGDPTFCGARLTMQWIDHDPSMPFALPLGTSQAGKILVGL